MADKQLFELDGLASPAAEDFVLASDTSGSNAPKKLLLSVLRNFILGTAACFNAIGAKFKLLADMDAGQRKITNLKAGSNAGDAVNYGQVESLVTTELPALAAPTLTQNASYLLLRSAVAPISFPHYLFYYHVDDESATELVLSEGVVQTSGGVEASEIASANNVATIMRQGIVAGQYIHVAVRYRNLNSISPLSATCSKVITAEGLPDLVESIGALPKAPAFTVVECVLNRFIVKAVPLPNTALGTTYVAEMVFNHLSTYTVSGEEAEGVQIWSKYPDFSYDIPLTFFNRGHAHVRIRAVSLSGEQAFTETVSLKVSFEKEYVDEELLDFIAERMSEKLMTMSQEPLQLKNPK